MRKIPLVSLYLLVTLLSYSNTHQLTTLSYIPPSHCTYPAAIAASDESFQLQADLSHMKLFSNEKLSPRPSQHDNNRLFQSRSAFFTGTQVGQIKAGIALRNMVDAFQIIQRVEYDRQHQKIAHISTLVPPHAILTQICLTLQEHWYQPLPMQRQSRLPAPP